MSDAVLWPRPYWQASPGADALLLFFIFGDFPERLGLTLDRHDGRGLPDGVALHRHSHEALRAWAGYPLAGALGETLREDNPQGVALAQAAPEVLSVRGAVKDPASLDYLRNTIGVMAGLLDAGGSVVVDPQMLSLFAADDWRQRYLVRDGAPPRSHVLILADPDPDDGGSLWVHTRGMRKFARPDIAIRDVPEGAAEHAGALCQKLVEMEALGLTFEAGQPLEVEGLSEALTLQLNLDMDDPRFNNAHLQLRWPMQEGAEQQPG